MARADPELGTSGAGSLIAWEAIRFAPEVTQRFDFQGATIEPVERFYRAFEAEQKPYHRFRNFRSLPMRILEGWRAGWRVLRNGRL